VNLPTPTGTVFVDVRETPLASITVYEKLSVLPAVRMVPFPEKVLFDDVFVKKLEGRPDVFVIGSWTVPALEILYEKSSYRYTGKVYDPKERSIIITS
jgi:hypothetical protein